LDVALHNKILVTDQPFKYAFENLFLRVVTLVLVNHSLEQT